MKQPLNLFKTTHWVAAFLFVFASKTLTLTWQPGAKRTSVSVGSIPDPQVCTSVAFGSHSAVVRIKAKSEISAHLSVAG